MTFLQEYTVEEAGFGTQNIRITVSDSVLGLYAKTTECDYVCDCIDIDTSKETLTLADNKFGVDELKFNINGAATLDSDGNKYACAFLLEAESKPKSRFIAVFFNPPEDADPDYLDKLLDSVTFRGKVNFNIQGTDVDWKGAIYSGTINALRDWTFQALSIDFSLLDKIFLTEPIELEDRSYIDGIYDRITGEPEDIFKPRLAYQGKAGQTAADWFYNQFFRLGSLYKVLQLIFDKTAIILNEIYPLQDFTVTLLESTLTLKTQPTGYGLTADGYIEGYVPQIKESSTLPSVYAANKKIQLTIKPGEDLEIADDIESPVFINERMFNGNLNVENIDWASQRVATENEMNFKQFKSVAELIFTAAKHLGCFVKLSLTKTNEIQVQFVSRDQYVESELTEVIDSTEASIELSGDSNEGKPTTYEANANQLADEGVDTLIIKEKNIITYWDKNDEDFRKYFPSQVTEKLTKKGEAKIQLQNSRNIDIKRLLFSTSQPIEKQQYYAKTIYPTFLLNHANDLSSMLVYLPMNIIHTDNIIPPYVVYQGLPERLHTGIYIRVKKTNMSYDSRNAPFYDVGADDNLFSPANYIHIKYDGIEESYPTLTEYINRLMQIDEQYYIQEYGMTIPYWNGFKKSGVSSWKNIKRGSKIQLTWNVITYNGTAFVEAPVSKVFIVNEIERNYKKPETKLKLHYEGRFSYAESTSASAIIEQQHTVNCDDLSNDNIKKYDNAALEDIKDGEAVMQMPTGIARAIPRHDYYGKIIGIAVGSVSTGETVFVRVSGVAFNKNYNFTGHIGEYIYCRRSVLPTLNISINCLTTETSTENILTILGKIDTDNSFVLGIMEIPHGGHYPEPPPP